MKKKGKKWILMEELIQLLDKHLVYDSHELMDNKLAIHVSSNRITATCPYCGQPSSKVHSLYMKDFQDLPIQENKVIIYLLNQKFFCVNPACTYKTFSERFDCISDKAKKTKRLEQEILAIAIHCSSMTASKMLKRSTVDISKSTICNLLHKEHLRRSSH